MHYLRLLDEYLYKIYPVQIKLYQAEVERLGKELCEVGIKFENQYMRLLSHSVDCELDKILQDRIHSGTKYFGDTLKPLQELMDSTEIEVDNKELRKKLDEAWGELSDAVRIKSALLEFVFDNGFQVQDFLRKRSVLSMQEKGSEKVKKREKKQKKIVVANGDIGNIAVYRALIGWRKEEAERRGVPVYTILQQKAILGLSNCFPADERELLHVPYIGKKCVEKYGKIILEIMAQCQERSGNDISGEG